MKIYFDKRDRYWRDRGGNRYSYSDLEKSADSRLEMIPDESDPFRELNLPGSRRKRLLCKQQIFDARFKLLDSSFRDNPTLWESVIAVMKFGDPRYTPEQELANSRYKEDRRYAEWLKSHDCLNGSERKYEQVFFLPDPFAREDYDSLGRSFSSRKRHAPSLIRWRL